MALASPSPLELAVRALRKAGDAATRAAANRVVTASLAGSTPRLEDLRRLRALRPRDGRGAAR